jgi:methionine biosynthesis protein MetW
MTTSRKIRVDLALIANMVAPNSRVLDIGCSQGMLIDYLVREKKCDARGIDIDMRAVQQAVTQGLSVMQGDADHDLVTYPDNAFDYVILSRTLQAVERPLQVLEQMLRIGSRVIVSFPNFGHWHLRWQLLLTGRMPMTRSWNRTWYDTPNIHPCTIEDFFILCARQGYVVEDWLAADDEGRRTPWPRSRALANLLGEQGLFMLRRAGA